MFFTLGENEIGDDGAQYIADILKENQVSIITGRFLKY